MSDLEVVPIGEVVSVGRVSKAPGSELEDDAQENLEQELRQVWSQLRDGWLETKQQRQSKHTQRSYAYASAEWLTFLAALRHEDGRPVQPWEATSDHVRLWQQYLREERGLAPASVNQRLAACSSFYSFVMQEMKQGRHPKKEAKGIYCNRRLAKGQDVAVNALRKAMGGLQTNPFSSEHVERVQVRQYHQARVLTSTETTKLLDYLESHRHTLTGARNWALLLTFLLTGYRNHEVVSMQWGNICPNRQQAGAWVYQWKGRGNQQQRDPLPNRVYEAIVHYLQMSGRYLNQLGRYDYIFVPEITHNVTNLKNVKEVKGYLSEKSALRILRTVLRKAKIAQPERMHIHDLRHTFAHRYRQGNGSLEALRQRLHHERLATTSIYAQEVLDDPVDDFSESLYQSMHL